MLVTISHQLHKKKSDIGNKQAGLQDRGGTDYQGQSFCFSCRQMAVVGENVLWHQARLLICKAKRHPTKMTLKRLRVIIVGAVIIG